MEWEPIVAAVIVAAPAAYIAWRTHKAVNSRMTEMLELARRMAAAEATLAERLAEKLREEQKE